MRLVTFELDEGPRPGLIRDDRVVDLSEDYPSLIDLIRRGNRDPALVQETAGRSPSAHLTEVALRAPILDPVRCIFATGWNYHAHFEEGVGKRGNDQEALPEHPTFFSKASTSASGPFDDIPYDAALTGKLDYEAELAVVIGRPGRSIPAERAIDHVFGYMLANDVSVRDVQRRHGGQWLKGKSLDDSCPLGPWLVTADEVLDPQNLTFTCHVNGEHRQTVKTSLMAFPVRQLIAELSLGTTLLPGDILLTGTPEGVGYARQPPVYLRPGDEVVISGPSPFGALRNRVVEWDLTGYATDPEKGRR